MKDGIQDSGHEVSIVIYDAPLPPKYFKLSKKLIRAFFVAFPLVLLTCFGVLFLWGLGSRVQQAPVPQMPQVLSATDSRVITLEAEIKNLTNSNQELAAKLSGTSQAAGADEPYLLSVKRPYGMQNLTAQKKVTLDQFNLEQTGNKAILHFQIISSSSEMKVMGHVLVFMISEAGMMAYPKEANDTIAQGIKYSSGEPFSVSRLRPTNAEFLHRLSGESVKFVVIIFSREGDLLLIQETPVFKVSAKS